MLLRQQQCFFNGQCKQPLTVNTILSPYCSLHLSYSPWGTRRGLFTNTTGITWPREPTLHPSTRWESISRVKRDINLSTHFSNCGCLFFFRVRSSQGYGSSNKFTISPLHSFFSPLYSVRRLLTQMWQGAW